MLLDEFKELEGAKFEGPCEDLRFYNEGNGELLNVLKLKNSMIRFTSKIIKTC